MKNSALLGIGRFMIPLPRIIWQKLISKGAQKIEKFTRDLKSKEEYRNFYEFVVRELPREGKPLSPEFIGQQLNMPVARVNVMLDTLEKNLWLFREGQEAVVWAYPVTAAKTPHYLTFSTGEKVYAA